MKPFFTIVETVDPYECGMVLLAHHQFKKKTIKRLVDYPEFHTDPRRLSVISNRSAERAGVPETPLSRQNLE